MRCIVFLQSFNSTLGYSGMGTFIERRASTLQNKGRRLRFAVLLAWAAASASTPVLAAKSHAIQGVTKAVAAPGTSAGVDGDKPGASKSGARLIKTATKKKARAKARKQVRTKTQKSRKRAIRRVVVPAPPSAGHTQGLHGSRDALNLKSSVVLVLDQDTNEVLFEKNTHAVLPIASLTKLMTALVVVETQQPLDEKLEITTEDLDREKHTRSRLRPGTKLSRQDMLLLALMSSENRAASALGRHYPNGQAAFVAAMNSKAQALGMSNTHYDDPTGLSNKNVSSAVDLSRLVKAAYAHPMIREYSTTSDHTVIVGRQPLKFRSSNRLVSSVNDWQIGLQKTGFTNEAGRCLVMQAMVKDRPVVMVFLDSVGKLSRFADANRVRSWLERPRAKSVALGSAAIN